MYNFDAMLFSRRLNFSHAAPTRLLAQRQRSTVSPPPGRPGAPYDLFLTMSHVIATGAERNVPREKVDRVANVISDLFFLVEYTLEDPVEDLLTDNIITLYDFFRRYGLHPEIIELSDDDSAQSATHVANFPVEYYADDDESTITDEQEDWLVTMSSLSD